MTNRKRNDKASTTDKASTSKQPTSLDHTHKEGSYNSDSNEDDAYDPLITRSSSFSKKRRNRRGSGKNDWAIPFDLRDLTCPSARNEIITTASKFAGTAISRSGRYIRPSWRDVLQNYIPSRRTCLFFGCIFIVVVVSGLQVIPMMNHEETRDYNSGYGRHDFSSLESVAGMSLTAVEHWCLLVDDHNCGCINPLKPLRKTEPWWNTAVNFNLELTENVTSDLDVVLLGDSIIEQLNGREMGVQKDALNGIKHEFNGLFRKENGGTVDGLALGIAGDITTNLLYRIQNGEIPKSLNPKVWWLLIGTNDLGQKECSEEIIFIGIVRIVEEILRRKPDSTVVINGILPRTDRHDGYLVSPSGADYSSNSSSSNGSQFDYWPYILTINDELQEYSETHDNVIYVDSSDLFLVQLQNNMFVREDKQLVKELMGDFLHPTTLGTKIWVKSIVDRTLSLTNSSAKP